MFEPTVDEIIEKAKQLCRLDGMLWSNLDFQNPTSQQTRTTARLAGEAAQWEYLERAQTLLVMEGPTPSPGKLAKAPVSRLASIVDRDRARSGSRRARRPLTKSARR